MKINNFFFFYSLHVYTYTRRAYTVMTFCRGSFFNHGTIRSAEIRGTGFCFFFLEFRFSKPARKRVPRVFETRANRAATAIALTLAYANAAGSYGTWVAGPERTLRIFTRGMMIVGRDGARTVRGGWEGEGTAFRFLYRVRETEIFVKVFREISSRSSNTNGSPGQSAGVRFIRYS